jgi:hypothetical protein
MKIRIKNIALTIACATTFFLGSSLSADAKGPAARCAAALERLDDRLDQCAGRCLKGPSSERPDCAAQCQDIFDAKRDLALAKPGCEALTDLMTMPAEGRAQAAIRVGAGSTGLWCACKLNCDNDYSGMPVLIRACKKLCDDQNKCRKEPTQIIGGLFIR